MKMTYEVKGGKKTEEWLERVGNTDMSSPLNQFASQGTKSLASATPRDSGETANSWKGTVVKSGKSSEVVWTNNAHPHTSANIAKMIELGHGTGTGGYVAPRPYIKQAMSPIWDRVDHLVKEMTK